MPDSVDTFIYDLFLSHSSEDKALVLDLAQRLSADGLKVWLDAWRIVPGDNIPSKLDEGLQHSRVLVLCMSGNASESDWALMEAGAFRFRDPLNKKRRFIPLRLDDAPIKVSLQQFRYIDWRLPNRDQAYSQLVNACRTTAEPSALAAQAAMSRGVGEIAGPTPLKSAPTTLDNQVSNDRDKDYIALARDGRYDSAGLLAKKMLAQAEATGDRRLVAHWADRIADAHRTMGLLREASAFYGLAWFKAQEALTEFPDDLLLRFQAGLTRFGQIIVDDYLMRGAFAEAYQRHTQLLADVDALLHDVGSKRLGADLPQRRIHIKRQQAEMLRYLGRYVKSLATIRAVLSEYPASAYEPRSYARLSEADSLRLQGDAQAAAVAYAEVEATARERQLDSLLGAVLWRKGCLLQLADDKDQLAVCLAEVAELADVHKGRYRFMVIYSLLLRASGTAAEVGDAEEAIRKAESFGPLRRDYLVTEYAHAALCRGELLRRASDVSGSLPWFTKALESYVRMECRWGIVRAWIGVQLAGNRTEFPPDITPTLEGMDAEMLEAFVGGSSIPAGGLSMNIP